MQSLTWLSSFELGIEEIDSDHKAIFALLREMKQTISDGDIDYVRDLLDTMLEMLTEHFEQEMALLSKWEYQDAGKHGDEHDGMLEQVRAIRKLCEDDDVETSVLETQFGKMSSFMVDDIIRSDLAYKSFLQERGVCKSRLSAR